MLICKSMWNVCARENTHICRYVSIWLGSFNHVMFLRISIGRGVYVCVHACVTISACVDLSLNHPLGWRLLDLYAAHSPNTPNGMVLKCQDMFINGG